MMLYYLIPLAAIRQWVDGQNSKKVGRWMGISLLKLWSSGWLYGAKVDSGLIQRLELMAQFMINSIPGMNQRLSSIHSPHKGGRGSAIFLLQKLQEQSGYLYDDAIREEAYSFLGVADG